MNSEDEHRQKRERARRRKLKLLGEKKRDDDASSSTPAIGLSQSTQRPLRMNNARSGKELDDET
jgi:hypothetical protein